jgi:hypothetical protein
MKIRFSFLLGSVVATSFLYADPTARPERLT